MIGNFIRLKLLDEATALTSVVEYSKIYEEAKRKLLYF